VEDVDSIARATGFRRHLRAWYSLGGFGPPRPDEPILVYRKGRVEESPFWDLTRTQTTHIREATVSLAQAEREIPLCRDCGVVLEGSIATKRRCDECKRLAGNAAARDQRAALRASNPPSKARTFTCEECQVQWTTEAPGRFRWCAECKSKVEARRAAENEAARKGVCAYRNCGRPFVDDSPKNGKKFRSSASRRREKEFRAGRVEDPTYFRDARTQYRVCRECVTAYPPDQVVSGRCIQCRDQARRKMCVECLRPFRDESDCNNRKRCPACG
jgi:hypothetical protein